MSPNPQPKEGFFHRARYVLQHPLDEVGCRNEADRAAWLQNALNSIPSGSRILDAGCGEQQFRPFCAHLDYVGQDFAQYDGRGDGVGLQTGSWDHQTHKLDIVSDITAIPEPDRSFDAILCSEVLEHVPDPVIVLKEFSRLLKPQGRLVLTAPFCSISHFTPYHFSTGFNKYWYETHLKAHGFRILEISPNGNYFTYLAQEIRRIPSVTTRYCPRLAFLSLLCRPLSLGVVALLALLNRHQQDSAALLCFGYHVVAERL